MTHPVLSEKAVLTTDELEECYPPEPSKAEADETALQEFSGSGWTITADWLARRPASADRATYASISSLESPSHQFISIATVRTRSAGPVRGRPLLFPRKFA